VQEPLHLGECFMAGLGGSLGPLPLDPSAREEAGNDADEREASVAHEILRGSKETMMRGDSRIVQDDTGAMRVDPAVALRSD
jgi:hypothetical protein